MSRRWRTIGSTVMSVVTFASVIVLATQAEGREASLAATNDGGAWLADRTKGGTAHVERLTRQWTVKTLFAEPRAEISVLQSVEIVAVHDRSASAVSVVDAATATLVSTTSLPVGTRVIAQPGGLFLFDSAQSTLWAPSGPELASAADVAEVPPVFSGAGEGVFFASRGGDAAIVAGPSVVWPSSDDGEPSIVDLPDGFEPEHGSFAGSELVLVDGNRWVTVSRKNATERELNATVAVGSLQQSSDSSPLVGLVSEAGTSVIVDLVSGAVVDLGDDGSVANVAPVFFDGCVFSLSGPSGAVRYRATCLDGKNEASEEPALTVEAELRLVNGSVWIDALDGSGFVVTPDRKLEAIADFSDAFEQNDGEESADGETVEQELDQGAEDADLTEADQRELDEVNEPPVAEDDEAATRLGRPVVVDVLANDTDPDFDVLLVDPSLELLSGDAELLVTSAANGVQVTPTGDSGVVTFRYSITDGSPGGRDSAVVTVAVKPLTQEGNADPVAVLDRATGAAGSTVSANLLENDEDPDGDSIVLLGLDTSSVDGLELVSIHPNGDVTLDLPATVGGGTFEIPYQIEDEWQASAEGSLRLVVRLDDANSPPDARNDAGITVVGRRIAIDLLANDVDADNDLLAIGQNAQPIGEDREMGFLETTEEGEFIFEPTSAGTFLFEYSATDRQESDAALIRVEVTDPAENRPPLAERDDVTLVEGERRLVRSLENDGDPDGDVIGVIYRSDNEALEIERVPGIGFWVAMLPGADPIETFDYRLSDGSAESGLATVVVARSLQAFTDAAPVVVDDSVRVRPGRSSQLFVLRNDYDPEGGPLVVTQVESTVDDVVVEVGSASQSVVVEVPAATVFPFALSYTVRDEAGNQQAGTVQVSIVPEGEPNTAPTARPDAAVTTEREPVLIQVLANDSDADSDSMSLTFNPEQPDNGVAVLTDDKLAIVYTANPGFVGTDTFTYLVQDSEGGQSVGSVRVGVMPLPVINQDPEAVPDLDYVFVSGAGPQTLDVLANDNDPDGDSIRVIAVDGPATVSADAGSVRYTIPSVQTESTFGFTYQIGDGRGGTDSAAVQITVSPTVEPLPPIARPDEAGPVRAGEVVDIRVTSNDDDPDGEVGGLVVTSSDAAVQVVGQSLRVTAPAETTDFRYTITDPQGLTATSTARVLVQPNLPPEVQSPNLGEFSSDAEFEIDLRPYATDPDDDPLVFSGISAQIGGTPRTIAEVSDASRVIFLPSEDYSGEGGFSFTVDDGNGNQVTGRVTFTLTGPNNAPPEVVPAAPVDLEAGLSQSIDFAPFFIDPDDDPMIFTVTVSPGSPVAVESQGPSSFTIGAPITAEAADTTFTVEATDPDGETAVATVDIRVTATTAEPPVANPDSGQTNQGEAVTVNVLGNDLNRLGQGGLSIVNVFTNDGTATEAGDGASITFTPGADFFGTATVQYTVSDERNNPEGEAQGTLTVTVIGRPAAPTGLQTTALPPRSLAVTWRAPDARGAAIERYDIEVNGTVEQGTASPSRTLNDLNPGEPYVFRVRAVNTAGDGEWSAPTPPIVVDQVPGAPGKPAVQFGDGELALSWAPAPNEGSAIETYEVEIGQCRAGRQTTAVTSYTWTGLTNGTRCSFQVRAVNQAGEGPYSPPSDLECPVGVPGAPSQPTAIRGDKEATVTFAQPTNPDCESLLGYEITRNPGGVTSVPAGTLQWNATQLLNGTSYTFQVRAENRAGWGQPSPLSDRVIPCGVPLAPPAPTAVRGDKQATVSLNGTADANGCAIQNYQVAHNSGAWQDFGGGSTTTVTGLTNGTSYTFQTRAVNEIGIGASSTPSNAVVPAGPPIMQSVSLFNSLPGWPLFFFVQALPNGESISQVVESGPSVGPLISSENGEPNLFSYGCINSQGNRCQQPASGNAPPSACVQTSQTVTGTFVARNSIGTSNSVTDSQILAGCPGAPSLSVAPGNGQFTASWSRPSGTDNIYIQTGGNYGPPRSGSSQTFSGNNGTTYSVTAWACNEFGCSKSSTQTVIPVRPVTISLSRGGVFVGGSCGAASGCRYVNGAVTGFTPNVRYHIACFDGGGDFVNTATNTPVVYRARSVDGSGSLSWGDGICGSNFGHSVRVWTNSGDTVTGSIGAP